MIRGLTAYTALKLKIIAGRLNRLLQDNFTCLLQDKFLLATKFLMLFL